MEVLNYKEFRVTNEMLSSKTKRFLNYLIDLIIFYSLFAILGIVLYFIADSVANEDLMYFLDDLDNVNPLLDRLITAFIMVLFYTVLEGFSQKTVGKLITQTKVVLEDGEKPSFGVILKRSLSRIIPFEAFSFLGETSRGWHDSISKTYVVDAKIFDEQKKSHEDYLLIGKETN